MPPIPTIFLNDSGRCVHCMIATFMCLPYGPEEMDRLQEQRLRLALRAEVREVWFSFAWYLSLNFTL